MPVARHKYDITRAEFAEIAEAAAEAVVAELKARADQLVPRQADEMRQLAEWLATTVVESIQSTVLTKLDGLQLAGVSGSPDGSGSVVGSGVVVQAGLAEVQRSLAEVLTQWQTVEAARRAGLDRLDEVLVDLRAGLSENVTRQHVVLLEVLDQRLAELRLNELADGLPARIGAVISEGIERSHAAQMESVEALKADLGVAIDAGLERHDAVMADLGVAIDAGLERHDAAIGDLVAIGDQLMKGIERSHAGQLDGIERSHAGQLEAIDALKGDLGVALDAGLERHRAAIIELVAVGERLTGLADEVSEAVERVVGSAFERAQGAQMQRLSVLMQDLRSQHEEVVEQSMTRLETALAVGLERQEALLQKSAEEVDGALERGLERQDDALTRLETALAVGLERQEALLQKSAEKVDGALERGLERQDDALTRLATALAVGLERQEAQLQKVLGEVESSLERGLERQDAALAQVRSAEERVLDLIDTVPDRVVEVLADSLSESASRASRVENLLGELAWALGEMRAGNDGLRTELARVAAELPDSAAALQDAAGRSEARLVDLIARVAAVPSVTNGSH